MLSNFTDSQNAVLVQIAYVNIYKKIDGMTVGALLDEIPEELIERLTSLERAQLESLIIIGYKNDNENTGFCAIAFQDPSSRAVGISYRGTEPLEGWKDMIDNAPASVIGLSSQIDKAKEFYNELSVDYNVSFLYGHSKGGDLAMEVYVANHEKIKEVHIINAQPINIAKLSIEQKAALYSNKVDAIIIIGDFVGWLGFRGYNVRYVKNKGSSGLTGPHSVSSAGIDDGNYIEVSPFLYKDYFLQSVIAVGASLLIGSIQVGSALLTDFIVEGLKLPKELKDTVRTALATIISISITLVYISVIILGVIKAVNIVIAAVVFLAPILANVAIALGVIVLVAVVVVLVALALVGMGVIIFQIGKLLVSLFKRGIDISAKALKWMGKVLKEFAKAVLIAVDALLKDIEENPERYRVRVLKGGLVTTKIYVQGGFPETGQRFIAREAGPELVGTIRGRNAVVNNNQIVESVSIGVCDAFKSALHEKNSKAPMIARVFIDGRQIAMARG